VHSSPLDRHVCRVDVLVLDDVAHVAKVQRGGKPVQLHVGRAEAGLPVVRIRTKLVGGFGSRAEQVVGGRAVVIACGGNRGSQVKHAVQA
jgi:hypothetical protein